MWNEINNQEELDKFMDSLYGFHDSCLKELKYISGAYVQKDLSMYPINDKRILKIIIQRQFNNPSVIEMEFRDLKYLSLIPFSEKYTCEILDVTMLFENNFIYWCDQGGLSYNDLDDYEGTVICAKKLRWRAADEYLGKKEMY